jgi:hypothetical protein
MVEIIDHKQVFLQQTINLFKSHALNFELTIITIYIFLLKRIPCYKEFKSIKKDQIQLQTAEHTRMCILIFLRRNLQSTFHS